MHILIVAATGMEIEPVVAQFRAAAAPAPRLRAYRYAAHDVDVLLSGIGMIATAAWCSHVLARETFDLALNFGVCGSFDSALPPGCVVHVTSDRVAELGAEDGDAFLTLPDMQLAGDDEFPFTSGRLVNAAPPGNVAFLSLPTVSGITVNTVHGNERSIEAVSRRFSPQVESMEGAAFMYACMIHGVAHAQVRAVSNRVEKRNRGAWQMASAIDHLARIALSILDHA